MNKEITTKDLNKAFDILTKYIRQKAPRIKHCFSMREYKLTAIHLLYMLGIYLNYKPSHLAIITRHETKTKKARVSFATGPPFRDKENTGIFRDMFYIYYRQMQEIIEGKR